ncbi:MAG: hypothetical protein ACKO26_16435 [Planctomycetota bacterium]
MSLSPMPAAKVLEQSFLEIRCRLLDLAALLDRVERGGGASNDTRMKQVMEGLSILAGKHDRAEKIQELFSLPYDASWERPQPRF